MPSLSRRDLLRVLGVTTAAGASLAAAPRGLARLLDTTSAVAADGAPMRLVRVPAVSGRRAAIVAQLDDTHRVFADGSREFLLWPGDELRLREAGIPFTVAHDDLLSDVRLPAAGRTPTQPGQRETYRRWPDFEADLRFLAESNPGRARLLELPHPSFLGRTVYGIEIATDVTNDDGRPVVYIDGMHHAREWPAAEMPIMWAFDLLQNYGSDAAITRIVDEARTIVLPNMNPDGFVRSREAAVQVNSSNDVIGAGALTLGVTGRQSYWRKNLRTYSGQNIGAPPAEAADAHGIDLNRNYPFLWGDNEGSSGNPETQTYRGAAPYSEPESHNVRDTVLSTLPITAITHHTSGRLMLYAWGRDPEVVRSPDADLMQSLGEEMALSNNYNPQQAFRLYPTSGTSRDWAHAATSTLIYTFEHGDEFHGPYEDTIPLMYAINRGAFVSLSNAALDPSTHVVLTGRVSAPGARPVTATVTVRKAFQTPTAPVEFLPENLGSGALPLSSPLFGPIDDTADPVNDNLEGAPGAVDEVASRTCTTGPDGSFTIHVPPSTRPFLAEERFGGPLTEPWEVVFTVEGREPVVHLVDAARGDRVDLGRIVLR